MTQARHLTVAEGQQGLYHCIARCVRRAWLCGVNPITKVDYEHRKPMIAGLTSGHPAAVGYSDHVSPPFQSMGVH